MIGKNINEVVQDDLQALVANSVLKTKTLVYKQSLPANADSDKIEFLADVSSFANASGGDLIYGIVEDKNTGCPSQVTGLTVDNIDREISRLENMIRDGIEPRIHGITIHPVRLDESRVAFIIRIPKSWIGPHRVIFKKHDKFYSRNTNGKYPMDVTELRIAFNFSETLAEKLRKFRDDRVAKIYAAETPVPLSSGGKLVLHVIPVISFYPGQAYDLGKIQQTQIRPIYCSGWNARYNFDGFLAYSGNGNKNSHSYVQLYQNGIIEAVDGLLLSDRNESGIPYIPSVAYERELISALEKYLLVLRELNVEPPLLLYLTLINVKGYVMAVDRRRFWNLDRYPIDRDLLLTPETVINDYTVAATKVLKPSFDLIWRACGFSRSLNYDENGEWIVK